MASASGPPALSAAERSAIARGLVAEEIAGPAVKVTQPTLGAREPTAEMERVPNLFRSDPSEREGIRCFELTLDEARTLADAFLAPPGGGSREYSGIVLRLGYQPDPAQPGATREEGAYIWFDQLLPDTVPLGAFGD
jgi:hypothetical protein